MIGFLHPPSHDRNRSILAIKQTVCFRPTPVRPPFGRKQNDRFHDQKADLWDAAVPPLSPHGKRCQREASFLRMLPPTVTL